jgi:hypothetical protein
VIFTPLMLAFYFMLIFLMSRRSTNKIVMAILIFVIMVIIVRTNGIAMYKHKRQSSLQAGRLSGRRVAQLACQPRGARQ